MNFAAHGTTVNEIERIFRIDDNVLRYLTIKLADSIDEAGITAAKDEIAAVAAAAEAEAEAAETEETEETEAPAKAASEETAKSDK